MNEDGEKNLIKGIKEVFFRAGVFHSEKDVQLLIDKTNLLFDRGWRYSYIEVANWITHEDNLPHVNKHGLTKVLENLDRYKMPPIRGPKKKGRNEPCECGEKKQKQCNCELKTQ